MGRYGSKRLHVLDGDCMISFVIASSLSKSNDSNREGTCGGDKTVQLSESVNESVILSVFDLKKFAI